MVPRESMSKWQRKSVALNQVRWELEKILTEDLTPEERNTPKYRELVSCVYSAVEHAVPAEHAEPARERLEQKKVKRKPWLVTAWYSLAASAGGIAVAIAPTVLEYFVLGWKYVFGG